jgi:hypothetical protein
MRTRMPRMRRIRADRSERVKAPLSVALEMRRCPVRGAIRRIRGVRGIGVRRIRRGRPERRCASGAARAALRERRCASGAARAALRERRCASGAARAALRERRCAARPCDGTVRAIPGRVVFRPGAGLSLAGCRHAGSPGRHARPLERRRGFRPRLAPLP